MDKFVLLLWLLGVFPFMFFQGVVPSTLCMVCSYFKNGHCLRGKGNCTVEQGPGCRTTDFFIFTWEGGWKHNHTELDCSEYCLNILSYIGDLKTSVFCCKGQKFCNKYQGSQRESKE